jgi:hypothetical protein
MQEMEFIIHLLLESNIPMNGEILLRHMLESQQIRNKSKNNKHKQKIKKHPLQLKKYQLKGKVK